MATLADVQAMIEDAEAAAKEIERHLAKTDFDVSEEARMLLSESRRWLRWAERNLERARESYAKVGHSVKAVP